MPIKPAYRLMQAPLSIDTKRSFQIVGHIKTIEKDIEETYIVIVHANQFKYDDNLTEYTIYYHEGKAKIFIDKYAELNDLIIAYGELRVNSAGQLYLLGDYAMLFRGEINVFDIPPPKRINPEDVPDRAF